MIREGDKVRVVNITKEFLQGETKGSVMNKIFTVEEITESSYFDSTQYWLRETNSDIQFWRREELELVTELEIEIMNIEGDV